MYARLQTLDGPFEGPPPGPLVETVSGHPGFAGLTILTPGTLLTCWETEEDARRASERTAAQLGPRPVALATDEIYEVVDVFAGAAAAERPVAATVMWFDGPLSQDQLDAATRGGRERIAPALSGVAGLYAALVLWQPERRELVILQAATSAAALERAAEIAMSTELLPGEDPALLPGPDRISQCEVVEHVAPPAHAAPAVQR